MKTIIISVIVGLIVVAGALGGYYWWSTSKEPKTLQNETEVPVGERALDIADETEGIGTDEDLLPPNEIGDQATETSSEETTGSDDIPLDTGSPLEEGADFGSDDLSGDILDTAESRDLTDLDVTPEPRETRPPDNESGRPGEQPSETEGDVSPTPKPTTPVAKATPVSKPTPGPAPGNFSVRTVQPVFKSQLAAVRKAMQPLGVRLKERQTEQQYLSAYRIAIGYFRTKAEAESWAYYNFRPKGIDYYVYPVQGMFSIQVGVYAQQQNIEPAMRQLYRKFQGGRLPIRTEMTNIATPAYELSISRITESLAVKVEKALFQMGIVAHVTGG
jgi:hypothetical protein